ncbi:MAG TPA: hypothetical protein VM900_00065 [Sphingomonas sp.]|jgi:hypothetical protein|nr:hypothetical protein [Sphingomonas sp.]
MSDHNNDIGEQASHIASLALSYARTDNDEILVYIEAEAGMTDLSIFQRLGDDIVWVEPEIPFSTAVMDFWYSAPDDSKWAGFLMIIQDGEFDLEFFYPDSLDNEQSSQERRQLVLTERYGDLPVHYN